MIKVHRVASKVLSTNIVYFTRYSHHCMDEPLVKDIAEKRKCSPAQVCLNKFLLKAINFTHQFFLCVKTDHQ